MHRVLLAFGVLVTLAKYCEGQLGPESLYGKRYQRLDIDTILASPRLVTNYVECLLNRKPCPPEGKDLKRILPEALRTKCGRCWPNQKEGAIKVITKLYYDYPEHYLALRKRWDTTGEYHRRFEEYLRDQQFNVISGNGFEADINRGDQSQIAVQVSPVNAQAPDRRIQQDTPQVQDTTTRVSNSVETQRPTRQDDNTPAGTVARDEVPMIIANRFGDDPSEFTSTTTRRAVPQRPVFTTTMAPSSVSRPLDVTTVTYRIVEADPNYMYMKNNSFQTRNPILNLINRLTIKFSNTAEFLAGMLQNTGKRT